jgi:ribosomal protein S18 acetylase RimI-like enzyme
MNVILRVNITRWIVVVLLLPLLIVVDASWIVVKPPSLQVEWKQMISLMVQTWDTPQDEDTISWWERLSWDLWGKNQAESKLYRKYVRMGRKLLGSKYAVLVAKKKKKNNEGDSSGSVVGMAELGINPNTEDGKSRSTLGILCVDHCYQRQGIGRALIEECLRIVNESWNDEYLYAEIQSNNVGAIALFQSCGFRQVNGKEVMVRIQQRGGNLKEQPHLLFCYKFTENIQNTSITL